MTSSHQPVYADRVRRIPHQFSWIDHRLVREYRIDGCSHGALALYLFLITVADAKGLSYYGDATLMKRLSMEMHGLASCRNELVMADLIAYRKPVSQVLPLEKPPAPSTPEKRAGQMTCLKDILIQAAGGDL